MSLQLRLRKDEELEKVKVLEKVYGE